MGLQANLFGFLVVCYLLAKLAILVKLELVRSVNPVARRVVIPVLTLLTRQYYRYSLVTFLLCHCSNLAYAASKAATSSTLLLEDLGDQPCADCASAFSHGEAHTFFKRNWLDQGG